MLVIDEGASTQYWERGVPTGRFLNSTNSGTQVYGTNLDDDHDNNIKSYLVSPCYDLSNLQSPELSFYMAYELEEDWDIVYVEYSIDSGDTWQVLGTANDPNWYNSDTTAGENNTCFNCPGAQWTGSRFAMQEYVHDLSAFGSETNIQFRIVFHSDPAVVEEGAIVDDFVVRGTLSTTEFNEDSFAVYPNPSNGIFHIKSAYTNEFDLMVVDISGKQIFNRRKVAIVSDSYQLDLRDFASGVYFLQINTLDGRITKKLIVTE